MSGSPRVAFCTICEGDYHHGVAALLNSLIASGFAGTFVVGWRGAPPPWMNVLKREHGCLAGVEVVFHELETPWFLAHVKPQFMMEVLDRIAPNSDCVFYADPDVVIDAPWTFFLQWVAHGVAVCEDCCFPSLGRDHYLRRSWVEFAREALRMEVDGAISRGFNSGFVGLRRVHRQFLETWREAIDHLPSQGVSLEALKPGTRLQPFFGTDQDMLNIAIMAHSDLICSLGPEGMGFTAGMTVMWHAADTPKPWRRKYLIVLLTEGRGVGHDHRNFWRYAEGPVRSWTTWQLFLHRLDLRLSVVISRFYHSA